jgi:hypothetical protein
MAATKVGIIYSLALRNVRAVCLPDHDSELPLTPRTGEGYIEQLLPNYQQFGAASAVLAAVGKAPLSDQCVLIDPNTNFVVATAKLDPAIDSVPGFQVIQHDKAGPGDRLNGAIVERRYASIDATGLVSIVWQDTTKGAPTPPVGGIVMSSLTLQPGAIVIVPKSSPSDPVIVAKPV